MGWPAAVGAMVGAGISGISTLASQNMEYSNSKTAARDQYERSIALMKRQDLINRKNYQQRYQWTAKDMRKAGLNPILAASGGFNVSGAPEVGLPAVQQARTPTIDFAGNARDVASAVQSMFEARKKGAEVAEVEQNIKLLRAKASESIQSAWKLRKEQNLISANERRVVREIERIDSEMARNWSQARQFEAQIDELQKRAVMHGAETENLREMREQIQINKELLANDVKKMEYSLKELKKISEVYDGPIGSVLAYVKEIVSALGLTSILGGIATRGGTKTVIQKKQRFFED